MRFLCLPLIVLLISAAPWEPIGLSGGGSMYNPALCPADPKTAMIHCDMSAAYLTHDGGASWQMIHTDQLQSNTQCRAAFDPLDAKTLISPHGSSELRITHDGGSTWEPLASFDDDLIGPITISSVRSQQIMVGVGSGVRLSVDGGKAWKTCDGPTGTFVGGYFGQNRVAIATNKGIWIETGDGPFSEITDGLPSKEIRGFSGGSTATAGVLYCTVPSTAENGHYIGGIFRSRNWGKSWQPAIGVGLNLDTKKFDEWGEDEVAQYYEIATTDAKPETVWATSGNTGVPPPHQSNVYRSDDGGQSWRATFFPDPRYDGFNVTKDYTVVEDGQFYQDRPQISLDAHDPNHVMQINGDKCYITADGGGHWTSGHTQAVGEAHKGSAWHNTGLVVTTTWHYYIDPHEPNRHYICYTDLGFSRSLDAGKSWIWWNEAGRAPWRNTCYELAFDPDQSGKIFGAFSDIHDIPNSNIIMNRHGHDGPGGICVSTDFAETWKPLAGGLPEAPATAIVLDPKHHAMYAGFFGSGVFKSIDDGQSWTAKNNGLGDATNMRVCRVQLHPDGTLFVLVTALTKGKTFQPAGVGLYRSSDAGESWMCISGPTPALWPKDFTLDPADSNKIYLSLADANHKESAGLYRTSDSGKTWERLARLGPEHFSAFLNPHHPGWIYATLCEEGAYGIYLSKDDGKTFEPMKSFPFDNATRITFDPADENMMYVNTFGGSVWHGPCDER